MRSLFLFCAVAPWILHVSDAQGCPNRCSGRGECSSTGICTCFQGYRGADCSLRSCPTGSAWFDVATETDEAHHAVECSNMGLCDTSTGVCACRTSPTFVGAACDRLDCPSACNGHGACLSLADAGADRDDRHLFNVVQYTEWDADRIFGCVCDSGWTGYDCSLRTCPTGDDPLTTGQDNEVQQLVCDCDATCSGTFTLGFRGETTAHIAHDADADTLKAALESLLTIDTVEVALQVGSTVCNATGAITTITFTYDFGDLPPLRPYSFLSSTGATPSVTVSELVTGSKEGTECSSRGLCDRGLGLCACQIGFTNSDGYGEENGTRPDCGAVDTGLTIDQCFNDCSGHGSCSGSPEYTCSCYDGWTGADCSLRSCPTGLAWWDEPQEVDGEVVAHQTAAECSNRGLCDRTTGQCQCQGGFEGTACERLSCPNSGTDTCSSVGRCVSLRRAALLATSNGDAAPVTYGSDPNSATTWDADRIQGCLCDAPGYSFPRGHEGHVPSFAGYDCSLRNCSVGDDPMTAGVKEQQTMTCNGTSGSFTVTFRQQTTDSIAYDATLAQLEWFLEELTSVGNVTVSGSGSTVCDGNTITVQFDSAFGDLPLMTADDETALLPGSGKVTIQESQAGSKETLECSGNGICDTSTGRCQCARGFSSSDGSGEQGQRPDCGFSNALAPGGAL